MKKQWTIIWSLLVILVLIIWFFILNENGNRTKDKDDKRSKNNAKILAQIKDEDFWNKKIEEIVDNAIWWVKWEIQILWYWLLCEQWKEYQQDLSQCEYTVWFLNKVGEGHFGYDSYCHWTISNYLSYCGIAVAMNDIWNWGVFYNDRYSTGINLKVNNNDWTATYYLYSVNHDSWEILNKNEQTIINRNTARDIIAKNAWVDKNVVNPHLRIGEWIYECDFSYEWHTYDYKISAKDWTIINGWDEIDIWEEVAMEIATKDAWIDWDDLMLEVDHWHMFTYLFPHTEKIWTGNSALYRVAITTNKDKYYLYDISATDGKILSSKFGEKFVIYDKKWSSNDLTFRVESAFSKKQKYDIMINELEMDNIYEFKDLIYLWVEFEWDKIVDWSIIDRDSEKNMWKMTKKELDELYNFESHHMMKEVTNVTTGFIYISNLKENIIYKYDKKYWWDCDSWSICSPKVVNDLWENVILYENFDKSWDKKTKPKIYKISSIVYNIYPSRNYQNYYENSTIDWNTYYVMYKKANESDLLKIMDDKSITFLSKYEIWEIKRWYDENYLYNDTNRDITVLIQDRNFDDMKTIIKPWKFMFCSRYVDNVTILN